VRRLAPPLVLLLVTALDYAYGRFAWSWLAGPVAAILVFAVERASHGPAPPAARHRRVAPAPVD
jgi:hypothetical protein